MFQFQSFLIFICLLRPRQWLIKEAAGRLHAESERIFYKDFIIGKKSPTLFCSGLLDPTIRSCFRDGKVTLRS